MLPADARRLGPLSGKSVPHGDTVLLGAPPLGPRIGREHAAGEKAQTENRRRNQAEIVVPHGRMVLQERTVWVGDLVAGEVIERQSAVCMLVSEHALLKS